ncbi:hypothetical protein [Acinetobacter pittii]|uniref:hypothetical protein n=1 Tax=Acinetobacter pittii TaxID=48296 RepID=UPI0013D513CF|nr:hypothetical protein [Acinetobacter pittii]
MYIKFLKHGKGDPAKAASYLVDDVDHLNRPRPHIEVLRGDPQTFTAIAESIQNEWKYTSGVIAWSKDDAPTNDEINEVLDTFEAHAFSGLKPTQYHFTAVLHEEDDGSKHVHFLVPRLELETGKALNIAPPGNQKYFDPLRDYFNYSKDWSRPDDPALQRDTQKPDYVHFEDAAALRAGLKNKAVKDIREIVGSYIEQRVEHGFIRDRKDVLDAVSELGTVTRTSDQFISLKIDGSDKAIRLKGAFYESEFSVESYIENRTRKENDAGASNTSRFISEQDKEYAEELRARVTELAKKRAAYNEQRYGLGSTSSREHDFSAVREQELSSILTSSSPSNNRPLFTADATATTAQSTVSAVEQYQSRHIQDSKAQESPFYIKCDFSFDSSYFAYQQFCTRIRQQEQIQRYTSDAKQSRVSKIAGREHEYPEVRNGERLALVRSDRPDREAIQQQHASSEGNKLNESRIAVIENHRRTTASIEATTARTRESTATYSIAITDNRAVKELHENFTREAQRNSEDRAEISADRAESIRTDYFSKFFEETTRKFGISASRTFERISDEFEYRFRSEANNSQRATEVSASRDRATIEADDRSNHQENEFSRAISTKISGINPTGIFTALDQIDKRRELQRAQERKNDRGYDSPSPF